MPLAEQSIIAPGQISSRAPLKKSTVAWAGAIVVVLAVLGVMVPTMITAKDAPPKTTASTTAPAGNSDQIDGELAQAQRRRQVEGANQPKPPIAAASAVALPASSASRPVVPESARRDDNSGALYGKKMDDAAGAGHGVGVEQEAAARTSPSVKADFSEGGIAGVIGAAQGAAAGARGQEPQGRSASVPDRANDRVAALLDAARKPEAQPTVGAVGDRSWLKELAGEVKRPQPLRPYKVTNPYTLLQGKVIPAVLSRDMNTDLPGEVSACTTMDIYDSLSSRYMLIPKGSCLQGRYSNAVRMGQERILFAFTRLTMPNGLSVELPANPGSDLGGAAGIGGEVNNHFFKMFTSSLLIALLAERVERNKQPASGLAGGSGGAQSAAGEVLVDVSRTVMDRNKTIPPTITVEKGTRINVEVTRDIEFDRPYAYQTP